MAGKKPRPQSRPILRLNAQQWAELQALARSVVEQVVALVPEEHPDRARLVRLLEKTSRKEGGT